MHIQHLLQKGHSIITRMVHIVATNQLVQIRTILCVLALRTVSKRIGILEDANSARPAAVGWRLSCSVGRPLRPPHVQFRTYNFRAPGTAARDNHIYTLNNTNMNTSITMCHNSHLLLYYYSRCKAFSLRLLFQAILPQMSAHKPCQFSAFKHQEIQVSVLPVLVSRINHDVIVRNTGNIDAKLSFYRIRIM